MERKFATTTAGSRVELKRFVPANNHWVVWALTTKGERVRGLQTLPVSELKLEG